MCGQPVRCPVAVAWIWVWATAGEIPGWHSPQVCGRFDAATDEGLEKPTKLEKLHLFYGRNRGRALNGELVTVLSRYLDGMS